jgi:hypothetical protein
LKLWRSAARKIRKSPGVSYDHPHLRTIPSSDIRKLGRSATNSCNSTSSCNTTAHVATGPSGWKHGSNNTRATADAGYCTSTNSNDHGADFDDWVSDFTDRSADPNHHQSGRTRFPTCSAAKHRDTDTNAGCTESNRSAARPHATLEPDSSGWHRAMCNRAGPDPEQSTDEHDRFD